jgi:hypothetical protein
MSSRLCPQGNLLTAREQISQFGQAWAKARIWRRFVSDSPLMSGKARRRSLERRLVTPSPALSAFAPEDLLSDLPVELDELTVDRERGTGAGRSDPSLEFGEEPKVFGG